MNKYKVEIGYLVSFEVEARTKTEAENYAWILFGQSEPHEPEMNIKKIKSEKKKSREEIIKI